MWRYTGVHNIWQILLPTLIVRMMLICERILLMKNTQFHLNAVRKLYVKVLLEYNLSCIYLLSDLTVLLLVHFSAAQSCVGIMPFLPGAAKKLPHFSSVYSMICIFLHKETFLPNFPMSHFNSVTSC